MSSEQRGSELEARLMESEVGSSPQSAPQEAHKMMDFILKEQNDGFVTKQRRR